MTEQQRAKSNKKAQSYQTYVSENGNSWFHVNCPILQLWDQESGCRKPERLQADETGSSRKSLLYFVERDYHGNGDS